MTFRDYDSPAGIFEGYADDIDAQIDRDLGEEPPISDLYSFMDRVDAVSSAPENMWRLDDRLQFEQKRAFAEFGNFHYSLLIGFFNPPANSDNFHAPNRRMAYPHDEDNDYSWFDQNEDILNIWCGFLNRDIPSRFIWGYDAGEPS